MLAVQPVAPVAITGNNPQTSHPLVESAPNAESVRIGCELIVVREPRRMFIMAMATQLS
jgi:hypothetical protein